MATKSFMPASVLDAAHEHGIAYQLEQQRQDPQGLMVGLHNTLGN